MCYGNLSYCLEIPVAHNQSHVPTINGLLVLSGSSCIGIDYLWTLGKSSAILWQVRELGAKLGVFQLLLVVGINV